MTRRNFLSGLGLGLLLAGLGPLGAPAEELARREKRLEIEEEITWLSGIPQEGCSGHLEKSTPT